MQMKPIADGLASFGRGDDKMLVHMTPGEVAGLQAIAMKHGGSLTINPHTGLPEAGFLSSILPTIAGAGLMAMGVPSPWLAAGLVGGASALTSGSLKKGLMAGLGAFGGAGLGSVLGGMSETAAQEAARTLGQEAGASALGTTPGGIADALHVSPLDIADNATSVVPGTNIGTEQLADYTNAYQRAYGNRMAEYAALNPFEKMGKGLEYAIQNPEAALTKKNAVFAGSALAPMGLASLEDAQRRQAERMRMLGQQAVSQQAPGFEQYRFSPGSYNPLTGQFEGRGSQYLGRASTFAQGGSIPDLNQQYPQSDINRAAYATSSQTPMGSEVLSTYAPKTDPFTGQVRMASGGIAGLQEYKAGGQLLDGPGDGMSDDIPAVIKGERPQRAALADGEFVVPADVVSHLGNGSTKAGAKRLYAMMDKVRMARVGTKKQGRQINPEKFIPA